jgi:hypothetical protein
MGTNAFVILGQQGPQLASIFGSGGAVVGALIAFGALAGGVLVTALTGTTDAMKELEEEANKLSEDITRLTAAEQAYQRILIKEKIDDQKDALASLQEELKGASRAFVLLSGESQGESLKEYIETEEEFTKRTFEMRSEIQLAKQNIESLGKSIDGTSNITEDLIVNLEKEVQVLGLTARQAAILEAVNSGADPKDVNRLHLLYNKIEAHKKEQKALKDKAAEDKAASDKLENFNAKLDEQAQLMTLVGDALYLYQAQQAGATGADAKALAEK